MPNNDNLIHAISRSSYTSIKREFTGDRKGCCIVLLHRQKLFSRGSRSQAALFQHTRRAAYQAGHVWAACLQREPQLPSPSDWGWTNDISKWEPVWSYLWQAQKTCYDIMCNCKQACHGLCMSSNGNPSALPYVPALDTYLYSNIISCSYKLTYLILGLLCLAIILFNILPLVGIQLCLYTVLRGSGWGLTG